MGKQINYWMGYEDFLQVAQAALDCGCVIIKKSADGKLIYGHTLDIVTEAEHCYYFYVKEAGELNIIQLPSGEERVGGYNSSGNVLIEAAFSYRDYDKKELRRSRLYVISGYYDDNGAYIERPECVTKVYNRLVRVVKKVAPYTEMTDTYISAMDEDYLQTKEWKHKEYISPAFLQLQLTEHYKLC